MQKLLLTVAAFGLSASAHAQTTPPQQVAAPPASSAQASVAPAPRTVTKRVCQNVEVERSTGSRLSSTTKICKTIEVPAPLNDGQQAPDSGSGERH